MGNYKKREETSPERAFTITLPVTRPDNRSWRAELTIESRRLSFAHGSWTAPRNIRRPKLDDHANLVAVEQIKELLKGYSESTPPPIFVFDAGDTPGQLAQVWGSLRVAALTRLRAGRCFYADPTEQAPNGRLPWHGHTFACADPTTWPTPDQDETIRLRTVAYPLLRMEGEKLEEEVVRGLPPPLLRPASIEPLDLQQDGDLGARCVKAN